MYLVGGYRLPSFFTTCKTKENNISTRSLIKPSFSDRSTIIFDVSKPQNNLHSSNAFFTQSSMCLFTLQPPLLTFSNSLSSISKNQNFGINSLTWNSQLVLMWINNFTSRRHINLNKKKRCRSTNINIGMKIRGATKRGTKIKTSLQGTTIDAIEKALGKESKSSKCKLM